MARVLVTGGAGFIGSHLADALVEAGHEVSIIDNLSTGRREHLNEAATFHHVDLRDAEATLQAMQAARPEVVHHLAAQPAVRVSLENPVLDAECNIIGSLNLLQACQHVGTRRLVYVSSGGAVYGDPKSLPVREDAPIAPLSPYGVSKYAVECYLLAAHVAWGLDYVVMRYANVYGPRQDPHGEAGVVAIFTNLMLAGKRPVIFGDGEQTRDYIYVKDIVSANLAAMATPSRGAYNVGTGRRTSVNELFALLAQVVGYDGEPIHDEPRAGEVLHTMLDASRLTADTGWTPQFDLASGLQATVDYCRKAAGS